MSTSHMNILILGHAGYIGPVNRPIDLKKYSLKGIDTNILKRIF